MQPNVSRELAVLTRRFIKSMEAQKKRDAEAIASLTRILLYPNGEHAERLVKLIRSVVSTKDSNDSLNGNHRERQTRSA